MDRARIAREVHLGLTVVLTGIVVGDLALSRRRRADYRTYVADVQRLDPVMRRVAPPLFLSTIGAGVTCAALLARADPPGAALRALAAGLVATSVRTTLQINDPINQRMRKWDPQQPPPTWADDRARWEYGHRLRAGLLAGSALTTAVAARR